MAPLYSAESPAPQFSPRSRSEHAAIGECANSASPRKIRNFLIRYFLENNKIKYYIRRVWCISSQFSVGIRHNLYVIYNLYVIQIIWMWMLGMAKLHCLGKMREHMTENSFRPNNWQGFLSRKILECRQSIYEQSHPQKSKLRILYRDVCLPQKRGFQETACPKDRLDRSWLNPCIPIKCTGLGYSIPMTKHRNLHSFMPGMTREIHPLDPQPHRHSMLVPSVCAPRVTR